MSETAPPCAAAFLPDRAKEVLDPQVEADTDRLATNF